MMLHALQYLRQGYSVIPLKPRSKEPLIPWQEFQKRRATESEVKGWFTRSPNANVGIVTGSISNLVVVDVDGTAGFATLHGELARGTAPLQSTTIVLTGKGRQLYFSHPGGNVCNAVRKLPGIDIRGDGGYVVAPPSIHPNGRRYVLLGALQRETLAPFPSEIFATAAVKSVGNDKGWVAKALEEMTSGNIDNTLFRVCCRLRTDGYSESDALVLLQPHALRAGATPGHLRDKVRNVWTRYGTNNNLLDEIIDKKAESIGDFMAAITPVKWICAPIIANGTLVFVAGLPETQKTWILIDLALECARPGSGHWLELFPARHSRVLFVDQERFKGETQRRFKAVMAEKGLLADDLADNLFIRCGTSTRLDLEPSYRAFRNELLEIKPDLVIIDSWATFQTSDENSRQGVQIVLERIKSLRTEIGCTFIFIDHESKAVFTDKESNELPSAMRMVGSVAKPAAAETILTVRRFDADTVLVHHTKSTLASAVKSICVKVVDTEKGIRVYGEGE